MWVLQELAANFLQLENVFDLKKKNLIWKASLHSSDDNLFASSLQNIEPSRCDLQRNASLLSHVTLGMNILSEFNWPLENSFCWKLIKTLNILHNCNNYLRPIDKSSLLEKCSLCKHPDPQSSKLKTFLWKNWNILQSLNNHRHVLRDTSNQGGDGQTEQLLAFQHFVFGI